MRYEQIHAVEKVGAVRDALSGLRGTADVIVVRGLLQHLPLPIALEVPRSLFMPSGSRWQRQ